MCLLVWNCASACAAPSRRPHLLVPPPAFASMPAPSRSWNTPRAVTYRELTHVSKTVTGTAVSIQAMVGLCKGGGRGLLLCGDALPLLQAD